MTFQTEFPDYPVADMPAMPAHGDFVDTSRLNDGCPSIASDVLGITIASARAASRAVTTEVQLELRFLQHSRKFFRC